MSIEKRLQRKVVSVVGDYVKATKALRDVSIEVVAECPEGDEEAKAILELTSNISQMAIPLEIMYLQMEKKLSED